MKKKVVLVFAVVILMVVFLTGCIRTELGIFLNSDGSGSVGASVLIKKEFYEMIKEDNDPFEGKITFTEKIDGEDYVGFRETKVYDRAADLTAALLSFKFWDEDSDAIFKTVEIRKEGSDLIFRAELNTPESEADDDEDEGEAFFSLGDYNPNDMFKLHIIVAMPGEVKSHSRGTLEGRTVIWDVQDLTDSNVIEIVSDNGAVKNTTIALIILFVLIVALVILIVIQKTRKQSY